MEEKHPMSLKSKVQKPIELLDSDAVTPAKKVVQKPRQVELPPEPLPKKHAAYNVYVPTFWDKTYNFLVWVFRAPRSCRIQLKGKMVNSSVRWFFPMMMGIWTAIMLAAIILLFLVQVSSR